MVAASRSTAVKDEAVLREPPSYPAAFYRQCIVQVREYIPEVVAKFDRPYKSAALTDHRLTRQSLKTAVYSRL